MFSVFQSRDSEQNVLVAMVEFILQENAQFDSPYVLHFMAVADFCKNHQFIIDPVVFKSEFTKSNTIPDYPKSTFINNSYQQAAKIMSKDPSLLIGKLEAAINILKTSSTSNAKQILNFIEPQKNEESYSASPISPFAKGFYNPEISIGMALESDDDTPVLEAEEEVYVPARHSKQPAIKREESEENLLQVVLQVPNGQQKPKTMRDAILLLAQAKLCHASYAQSIEFEQYLMAVTTEFLTKQFNLLEKQLPQNRQLIYQQEHEKDGEEQAIVFEDLTQSVACDQELLKALRNSMLDVNKTQAKLTEIPIIFENDMNLYAFYTSNIRRAQQVSGQSAQQDMTASIFAPAVSLGQIATFENIDRKFLAQEIDAGEFAKLEKLMAKANKNRKGLSNVLSELLAINDKAEEKHLPEHVLIDLNSKAQKYINTRIKNSSDRHKYSLALTSVISHIRDLGPFLSFTADDILSLSAGESIANLLSTKINGSIVSKFGALEKVIINYSLIDSLLVTILDGLPNKPNDSNIENYRENIQALKDYFTFQFTRPSRFTMALSELLNSYHKLGDELAYVESNQLAILEMHVGDLKDINLIINATQLAKEFSENITNLIKKESSFNKILPNIKQLLLGLKKTLDTHLANKLVNYQGIAEYEQLTRDIAVVMATSNYSERNLSAINKQGAKLANKIMSDYYQKAMGIILNLKSKHKHHNAAIGEHDITQSLYMGDGGSSSHPPSFGRSPFQ